MKNNLTDKDFSMGGPEAWEPQERKNLLYNFLSTKQFSLISESEKIFLCGRRGSGKSAIAIMSEDFDSPYYEYREAVQGELSEYGTYMDVVNDIAKKRKEGADIDIKKAVRRLWLWVLPLKAMQTILTQAKKRGEPFDNDLEAMRTYLNSLPLPLHEDSRIGDLLSNTFKNALSSLQKEEAAFNTYLVNLTGSKEFRSAVTSLNRKTMSKRVLMVLDTLESYRIFQPNMIEGLQGVLEAIIAFLADERMQGISLKFFIPAEIYDKVFAGFPGKVQSRAVFLRWRFVDLLSILARRFLAILTRTEAVPIQEIDKLKALVDEAYRTLVIDARLGQDAHHGPLARKIQKELWYETNFLPEKIVNRKEGKEDCFAFMFRHTQRRPRDVITQMQHIINEARARGEFPYMSQASVVAGVHNSEGLQQILGDALTPYEGFLPIDLINGARSLFYKRPIIMKGRELRQFAQELYSIYPLENINPENFVNLLLYCGVIGLVDKEKPVSEKRELYCTSKFEYLMQGNLPLSDRFLYAIHPVMADTFGMTTVEDRGVIYPMPESQEDLILEIEAGIS